MAQADISKNDGVNDKRFAQGQGAANLATPANYASITALRTRLTAINGTLYSATNLDKLTKNDMIYALRRSDDTAGI